MKNTTSAEEKWRELVVEGNTESIGRKRIARFYALLPATSRCRLCNLPFAGFSGKMMQLMERPLPE